MTACRLFIATSIDGYIAREDGSIDWLDSITHPEGVDYGYHAFMEQIDTVVMGRKTYEDVVGFDVDWPYGGCNTVVVTSSKSLTVSTPNTHLIHGMTETDIATIKRLSQKDIWIVGGGELIASFLNAGLIDSMLISVIPVVLGSGRPLFRGGIETNFDLVSTESFSNGVVNLVYSKQGQKLSK